MSEVIAPGIWSSPLRLAVVISFATFVLCILPVHAQVQKQERTSGSCEMLFDPSRDPASDLRVAIAKATGSGKRILLDVGGDWCIWCHRLDQCLRENRDIARFLARHFVVVKVNYSVENRNVRFLSHYPKITGYPHLFVLESDGTLLHSQDTGELESGKAHDPGKVTTLLQAWARPSSRH